MNCEVCGSEMIPYKKKLGSVVNWMKCSNPECGVIERKSLRRYSEDKDNERLTNKIRIGNQTGFRKLMLEE